MVGNNYGNGFVPSLVGVMTMKQHGFTVLELMVALAIGGILAVLVIPGVRGMIGNSRLTTYTNDFITHALLARSEAMRRGRSIVICGSAQPELATPACHNSTATTDWSKGWVVFVDTNDDGVYDATEEILRRQVINDSKTVIKINFSLAGGTSRIVYSPKGMLDNDHSSVSATAEVPVAVAVCNDNVEYSGRIIWINRVGRAWLRIKGERSNPLTAGNCAAPAVETAAL